MAAYTIAELVKFSDALLGVPSHIAAGGLSGRSGSLDQADARTIIEAWLGQPLPSTPATPTAAIGAWRASVATIGNLPTSGNGLGDVRLVRADYSVYAWNGSAWVAITASDPLERGPNGELVVSIDGFPYTVEFAAVDTQGMAQNDTVCIVWDVADPNSTDNTAPMLALNNAAWPYNSNGFIAPTAGWYQFNLNASIGIATPGTGGYVTGGLRVFNSVEAEDVTRRYDQGEWAVAGYHHIHMTKAYYLVPGDRVRAFAHISHSNGWIDGAIAGHRVHMSVSR